MITHLPPGFRPSTLKERKVFYAKHFDAERAWVWVKALFETPVFAVKLRSKTSIYHPRFERLVARNVRTIYFLASGPDELRRKLIFYVPEGVYYWRNRVRNYDLCKRCEVKRKKSLGCFSCQNFQGQELVFDIDPENFTNKYPDFASFDEESFFEARDKALEILDALSEEFERVVPVYSGRGFHIHVLDEDAFLLPPEERARYAERFEGIDKWVTRGGVALIRLPYSLNGVVNKEVRVLTRKELERFDPWDHHSSSISS